MYISCWHKRHFQTCITLFSFFLSHPHPSPLTSGLLCKVSAGNENACLTTKHLTALGKLEPKLVPLVIAFRYWAKLCSIDRPEEGGLPPYVFALMAIFFLQQRKEPLLPVYLGSWVSNIFLLIYLN
uniref:polynucleotide adenylyltransferase n=1 Tax=Rhinopithecus bieti TaxID=61621 RepID=A0A2K6LI07_RHIBE